VRRTAIPAAAVFCVVVARGCLSECGEGVKISLRVSVGAKKSGIKGYYGERAVKLSVAAPPEGGRANAEAERLLAEALRVSASEVEVIRGASSRDKVVLVRGVSRERVYEALDNVLGGNGG
jgi:uncharacterized protein (TIGR00251 family)